MKFLSTALTLFLFTSFTFADEARVFVSLSPAGSFVGKANQITGSITKDGDMYKARDIEVDLTTLKTGIKLRDDHTLKHLEVSQFPKAKLIIGKGKGGKGVGKIYIRGVEKEVRGTFEVDGNKMKAQFPIKFSDFGINGIKYMGVGVKDEGRIEVDMNME